MLFCHTAQSLCLLPVSKKTGVFQPLFGSPSFQHMCCPQNVLHAFYRVAGPGTAQQGLTTIDLIDVKVAQNHRKFCILPSFGQPIVISAAGLCSLSVFFYDLIVGFATCSKVHRGYFGDPTYIQLNVALCIWRRHFRM